MMTVSVQKPAMFFVEIADTLIDKFDYMRMITE